MRTVLSPQTLRKVTWTAALYLAVMLLTSMKVLSPYYVTILCYICIDAILVLSLNLTNGYMGETNLGHAAFMGVGAYVSVTLMTMGFGLGPASPFWLREIGFLVSLVAGGAAAAVAGLILSVPAFGTRGDYLALVTFGFNMITINVVNNIEAVGGARGYQGIPPDRLIPKVTDFTWTFFALVVTVIICRNFLSSSYGRDVLSIRENELAADLMGVDTRKAKSICFGLSAALAGLAGGLYVHLLQYAHPSMFGSIKSIELLAMLHLGGIGRIGGAILGAAIMNIVLEGLRQVLPVFHLSPVWRMVVTPAILAVLMLCRPSGILGGIRELTLFLPPPIPGRSAPAKPRGIEEGV
ncbi:MAG: branched-chain amino acid ABC transporter permease [Ignavibacteriales bacterium]